MGYGASGVGVGDRGKSRRRVWWTALFRDDADTARSLKDGITIRCFPRLKKCIFPFFPPSVVPPGASLQGLSVFLERCEASGIIALSLLWADLTTTCSAVTIKSCLPSQRCHRWNCACARQVCAFSPVPVFASVGSSRALDVHTYKYILAEREREISRPQGSDWPSFEMGCSGLSIFPGWRRFFAVPAH